MLDLLPVDSTSSCSSSNINVLHSFYQIIILKGWSTSFYRITFLSAVFFNSFFNKFVVVRLKLYLPYFEVNLFIAEAVPKLSAYIPRLKCFGIVFWYLAELFSYYCISFWPRINTTFEISYVENVNIFVILITFSWFFSAASFFCLS